MFLFSFFCYYRNLYNLTKKNILVACRLPKVLAGLVYANSIKFQYNKTYLMPRIFTCFNAWLLSISKHLFVEQVGLQVELVNVYEKPAAHRGGVQGAAAGVQQRLAGPCGWGGRTAVRGGGRGGGNSVIRPNPARGWSVVVVVVSRTIKRGRKFHDPAESREGLVGYYGYSRRWAVGLSLVFLLNRPLVTSAGPF